jgi:hypothetical protein
MRGYDDKKGSPLNRITAIIVMINENPNANKQYHFNSSFSVRFVRRTIKNQILKLIQVAKELTARGMNCSMTPEMIQPGVPMASGMTWFPYRKMRNDSLMLLKIAVTQKIWRV